LAVLPAAQRSSFDPDIPRTWADEAVAEFELPLATPEYSPRHVPENYYYSLPVRPVYRSYPIYHPDHEPEGYRERLAAIDPEIAFDAARLATESDWVAAGAEVFRAAKSYDGPTLRPQDVLDPDWYEANDIGITRDGVFPYARWVIRERGVLEVGNLGCSMCHTRLLPDGTVIEGAQGNLPLDGIIAERIRREDVATPLVRRFTHALEDAPWARDPDTIDAMSLERLAAIRAAVPAGVMVRQGTAFDAPVKIPDLIGIRDRKYLDATGLVVHRGIGDIMRYAVANQTMDMLARFGNYVPDTGTSELPPPGGGSFPGTADRYSDAQLYALTLFLYQLEPPENPNPFDELAREGQQVFEAVGCPQCHPPPLYTNNMLVAAPGFDPPAHHYERYDISDRRVGTDPTLTMTTRRGTGYYKVPSLKGVWYRGPFEHSGSVATLEDWFDAARLEDDYMPTGFAGADGDPRPVPGHPFGLGLSDKARRALIAFLRTL
jgi:hypothetical protein